MGPPVVPDVYSQKAMSSLLTASGAQTGSAAASRPSSVPAPAPVATIARRWGTSLSADCNAPSSVGSATSTRARLSRSNTTHSAGGRRVLRGTATAPMRSAPKKVATHSTPSGSRIATRCSGSTPSPRSMLPARLTRPSSSRYVVAPPRVTIATRAPPRPAAVSSMKALTAFAIGPPVYGRSLRGSAATR